MVSSFNLYSKEALNCRANVVRFSFRITWSAVEFNLVSSGIVGHF